VIENDSFIIKILIFFNIVINYSSVKRHDLLDIGSPPKE